MIRSLFSILPASPVDLSQDIVVPEPWRARTVPGNPPQEAGTAHLRGFSSPPGQALRTEPRVQCHRISTAPSPHLGHRKSGTSITSRLAALCLDSVHPGLLRARVHGQPSSGGGCCHLLEEDGGQKRRAAQGQAKSGPGRLTQGTLLFCKRFCTHWSGAVQAPAHHLHTQKDGDRSSIPILEIRQVQRMLTRSLGCQHAPGQSCEPLWFRRVQGPSPSAPATSAWSRSTHNYPANRGLT